ncbi:MAG: MATE family efflux transporter [Cycloclasticus sp.]|nr:MATE family efflux transporter [Cycloclasticus sp. 44_32_T64]
MLPPKPYQDLTTGSIYRHLIQLAIPASMGMFFNTLYNLTDNWFAGKVSDDALVGLSISSIVFYLFIGLLAGLQNGTSVMVATEIGLKQTHQLKNIIKNAFGVGIIFSMIIIVLGLAFAKDTIDWLSTEDKVTELAWDYIQILIVGNIAFSFSTIAAGALMALGDTTSNRNALIVGFFANLGLNPLLTFGFEMGVAGLAWATLIIKLASALYLLIILCKKLGYTPFPYIDKRTSLAILRQVLPASFNFSIMIIGSLMITGFVSRFGDYAVAGYSVGLRLEQVLLLPALGLNAAVLAISGQNFGAKNFRRIAETYRKGLILSFSISLVCIPIMIFLSPLLMGFFSHKETIIEVGTTYLRIDALAFFCYVSLFISVATLQAIKQPDFPVIMGLFRQLILPLTVNYFLILHLGYGINWLFGSVALIVFFSMIITLLYTRSKLKQLV